MEFQNSNLLWIRISEYLKRDVLKFSATGMELKEIEMNLEQESSNYLVLEANYA